MSLERTPRRRKLFLVAGEASGDLHGSNLIAELKNQCKDIEIRCWGGDLINEQTNNLVRHHKDYSYMGFLEVFLNLYSIIKNISFCNLVDDITNAPFNKRES